MWQSFVKEPTNPFFDVDKITVKMHGYEIEFRVNVEQQVRFQRNPHIDLLVIERSICWAYMKTYIIFVEAFFLRQKVCCLHCSNLMCQMR
jgi:hypothetical protein